MDDRRREERQFLKCFASVTNRYDGQLIGYLYDLTTGGALIVSNQFYNLGEDLHLRIDMPENIERDPLIFEAKVIWIQQDEDPGYFRIGLKLIGLTPEEMSTLGLLLSQFGSPA